MMALAWFGLGLVAGLAVGAAVFLSWWRIVSKPEKWREDP